MSLPWVNIINIRPQFFQQYPFTKKSQSQTVNKEKLRNSLLYEKHVHKMLMKLTHCSLNLHAYKLVFIHLCLQFFAHVVSARAVRWRSLKMKIKIFLLLNFQSLSFLFANCQYGKNKNSIIKDQ